MKRGSALLIVVGMMSFVVVSAVSFSMFMRQSRLPSSFLRQKITASQLVKAGLAEAMARLDIAIGDDPFPGVGDYRNNTINRSIVRLDGSNDYSPPGNYWHNRVFMETQLAHNTGLSSSVQQEDFETVATLTLEGLAYLPPPLINTVRYWSRQTSTASWTPLGYDAGRYAFTAVNVSDYLDLTRLRASVMRDSTPQNRITLGYLFENEDHTGPGLYSPESFDAFVAKSTNDAFRTRFVSLADLNLAVGSKVYGDAGIISPFYDYIKSPPKDGTFYGAFADDARMLKFVTDSWYPGSLTNGNAIVLTDLNEGQPFSGKENATLDDLQLIAGSACYQQLARRIDLCSFAALYDYLDGDESRYGHVPISLAIPTMEHTPMLTGLCIAPEGVQLKLKCDEKDLGGSEKEKRTLYTWSIDSLGDNPKIVISACGVYPFKRKGTVARNNAFKFQVMVRGFFSTSKSDDTRLPDGQSGAAKNITKSWAQDSALKAQDKAYFTLVSEKGITVKEGALNENETTFDIFGMELSMDPTMVKDAPVYGLEKIERLDEYGNPIGEPNFNFNDSEMNPGKRICYYQNGNNVVRDFGETGPTLYLNYNVWARIIDGNGDTVDLVPAMISDDQVYNGLNSGDCGGDARKICGDRTPVIPLHSEALTDLTKAVFVQAVKNHSDAVQPSNVAQGELAIYCDDPRFNYAPEDWYKNAELDVQGSVWLERAKARCNGGDHRAKDIFQFVSDVGYDGLQSLGELQFLPYLTRFGDGKGGVPNGDFYNMNKYTGLPFSTRSSANDCANYLYAWKSHWSFGPDADVDDGVDSDPYTWGVLDSKGGPAISPFADSELMMVALANTPYDWQVAYGDHGLTLEQGRKYCFGPSSSEARMSLDDLDNIAATIRNAFNENRARMTQPNGWESVWRDDILWENDSFLGSELNRSTMHDVDRKFLYSYWKNCFGNEQQLFLIFVRAEPTVMTGDSAGHTPGQLGARAVALVWREPVSTVNDLAGETAPHRMRVLFYHEFEH